MKPDSILNYLKEAKLKNSFKSKLLIVNYLDSVSYKLSQNGFINNYYHLKEVKNSVNAKFILNRKIDTIQINFNKNQIDFSKISVPIIKLTNKSLEINTKYTVKFLNEMTNYFENEGYSFSKITLNNLKLNNSKIKANLVIQKSSKRQIDAIIIKGYKEISKKYLKKKLQLSNTTAFNKETLRDIDNTINSISFIEQTKQPEVLFTKDSTILYLFLKKKSINHINGIVGFSTNSENKININGDLDLQLSNIFNKGENFYLNWKSFDKNSSLYTHLNLPIVFTPFVSFKGNFNISKQDTSYTTAQGKLNIIYNINKSHSVGGIVDFENSNIAQKPSIENFNNYKKEGYGVTYSFYALNKTSNTPLQISLSYLKGKKNKTEKQENFNLTIENTFNLSEKSNIYFKLSGQLLNTSNIYKNELLRIGGYKSLRGFDELSIYTSKYALSNIEYRYYLNKKNFFYSVTDIALTNNVLSLEKKSLMGIGLGYFISTNNNLLNFSYVSGFKLNKNINFYKSKVYLSISYFF